MAPDSNLHRHHAAGSAAALHRAFVKAAALLLLSLLIFPFPVNARAESTGIPWALATVVPPGGFPNEGISTMSLTLPTPTDALTGTPAVLWRNRIQIPIHEPLVEKYIRFYRGAGRKSFSDAMKKGRKYIPEMTEILESQGVPAEMVSVVFVESGFKERSSYRGASGYWQLMAATARSMGLKVNRWVDERLDPIKSTKAAARYLKKLYGHYDSWLLALAAYNAGMRPINRAAAKHCAKDRELYGRRLPAYSAVYVAKVLAAMNIICEPEKYGFKRPQYCRPTEFDSVLITTPLRLKKVAQWIDVPVSRLKELNPSLRQDAMSPGSGFALRLPRGTRDKFNLAYEAYTRR